MATVTKQRSAVNFTREYRKCLDDLMKAGKREIVRKADSAMTEAQMRGKITLERTNHGETRLENCEKYDLGSGYRLVVQLVGIQKQHRAFLFAGSHDDTEAWLDNHRDYRWVQRPSDGTLDFVQVTTPEHIQPPLVSLNLNAPSHLANTPLLADLDDKTLSTLCSESKANEYVRKITRDDWERDANGVIQQIEDLAGVESACIFSDLLTLSYEGRSEECKLRAEVATGTATIPNPDALAIAMLDPLNSERLVTWDDSDIPPKIENWQDWMLFLHPAQRSVATRDYNGPARLRGVSGSGKTCVMIHRARYLAKKHSTPVAVLTLTESMRKLLDRMLRDLCGAEVALIETYTLSAFCKDVLDRHHQKGNSWYRFPSPAESQVHRRKILEEVLGFPEVQSSHIAHFPDKEAFLWELVQYVRTRFPTQSYSSFLDERLTFRHSALSHPVRKAIVQASEKWDSVLAKHYLLDNEGLVLEGFDLLARAANAGQRLPGRFRSILVDEVQDCTQMELRLLSRLWTPAGDEIVNVENGLFLVGDGAQTLYKKGFRLSQLGIDVRGRSEVLKKNYRNSREILEAAYSLIENYEYADVDEENIRKPQAPDLASRRGERPEIVFCRSREDEADHVARSVSDLLTQGVLAGQICIVGARPDLREICKRALTEKRIPSVELRIDADYDSAHVKISTIESAKGHDFYAVFVIGVNRGSIPSRMAEDDSHELTREASRLYVAMTRATHFLTLTCTSSALEKPSQFLAGIGKYARQRRKTQTGLIDVSDD